MPSLGSRSALAHLLDTAAACGRSWSMTMGVKATYVCVCFRLGEVQARKVLTQMYYLTNKLVGTLYDANVGKNVSIIVVFSFKSLIENAYRNSNTTARVACRRNSNEYAIDRAGTDACVSSALGRLPDISARPK